MNSSLAEHGLCNLHYKLCLFAYTIMCIDDTGII